MKAEFSPTADKNSATLKCFAAYLWGRGDHEVLKKIVLEEVYHDVLTEKDGAYPVDITALDPGTTLYKAIQEGTRGSADYPSGALALAPQEKAAIQQAIQLYTTLYMAAYVV